MEQMGRELGKICRQPKRLPRRALTPLQTLREIEKCLCKANDILRSTHLPPDDRFALARQWLIVARADEIQRAIDESKHWRKPDE